MKKDVIILGAGESGTGAALLAKAKGYNVFVSDQGQINKKFKDELLAEGIPFEEGTHTVETILRATLIVKSPGIPDSVSIVNKAKAASIEIIDEIEFAFRFISGNIIAITGTNGKTTTTLLIYHLMKTAGFNVAMAGNIGYSLARQVASQLHAWYVLEISSFQLDGTKMFAPHIGILLNITPDHLDRYDNSMQNYVASKFRLIQHMREDQYFIYYADDARISETISGKKITPQKVGVSLNSIAKVQAYYDGEMMCFLFKDHFRIAQYETSLVGPHNLINTMAAVSAVYLAGADLDSIREGLKTFKNAPHRLESVATIKGVEFVNDSKATNVDSVVYALGSYEKPMIWIAGGIDKGNDYSILKEEVRKKVRALICLGKDNEKLRKAFTDVVRIILETQEVHQLVRMALDVAKSGDVVLLSPACASFDLFKNYEDRGNQFKAAVYELKHEVEGAAA